MRLYIKSAMEYLVTISGNKTKEKTYTKVASKKKYKKFFIIAYEFKNIPFTTLSFILLGSLL